MELTRASGPPRVGRRGFLAGTAAVGLAACTGDGGDGAAPTSATTSTTTIPTPPLPGDPFTLGVASGDPLPDAVVLWTRLLPEEAPMPDAPVPVRWEVAADEGFTDPVAEGVEVAEPGWGHSVHVDAGGLEPATDYWYRFTVGDVTSTVGRTRTAPAADAEVSSVRLGVANCHAYQSGYFAAYRHLAEEDDLDAVLFLGDYIYELESSVAARRHGLGVPVTLAEFRAFYELNSRDPDLLQARARHPWVVTWDDHEVEDNYAADQPGRILRQAAATIPGGFAAKRAAAYQAWWEHMPIRAEPPRDGAVRIHRDLRFGDLVTMAVVDNRQYRTPQPEGVGAGPRPLGGGPQPPEAFADSAQMLGEEQEAWLFDLLRGSDATWTVLAQQSVMAEVNRRPDLPEGGFSLDSWDGYVAARQRLMDVVADAPVRNFVSIGGDIHTSAVTDLHAEPTDTSTPVVGTEFIGPSISALELLQPVALAGARSNDHVKLYDIDRRGYLVVEFTPEAATARYRWVDDALRPDSGIADGPVFRAAAGSPGAVEI